MVGKSPKSSVEFDRVVKGEASVNKGALSVGISLEGGESRLGMEVGWGLFWTRGGGEGRCYGFGTCGARGKDG
jgi:hypothetical protein